MDGAGATRNGYNDDIILENKVKYTTLQKTANFTSFPNERIVRPRLPGIVTVIMCYVVTVNLNSKPNRYIDRKLEKMDNKSIQE